MDGNHLLEDCIYNIEGLKTYLKLKEVIYAVKPSDEIRFATPEFDLPILTKKENSEKRIDFLKNGEIFYYKIYKEDIIKDIIFVVVLCRKASEGNPGKEDYNNYKKTYRFVTNSKDIANKRRYNLLFRYNDELTIDEVINELKKLKIPNFKR